MTDRVVSVGAGMPVSEAREWLSASRFTALPVVDDCNRLVGILSAADVVDPQAEKEPTVGTIMSRDVMWAAPDTDVGIIAHRLDTYGGVRVMPIVDHGFLVGIVTRKDLLRRRPRNGPLGRALHRLRGGRRADQTGPVARPAVAPLGAGASTLRDLRVRDVMTTNPLCTVHATTSVEDAAGLLTRHRWTALPVVDEQGRLVGVVGEADLVPDPLDGRRSPRPRSVGEAMTTDVVTVRRTRRSRSSPT